MSAPHPVETVLAFGGTGLLLYLAQRSLHRNLQWALLRLAGHPDRALVLYWALLFPGILLHELSHWGMALVLGIRRYRFAFWPRRIGGQIRLGAVLLEEVDPFRMSLVGVAPMVAGLALIALLDGGPPGPEASGLGLPLQAGSALLALTREAGGWVRVYLLFAVGNTMWPSPSDRAAWPVVGGIGLILAGLALAGLPEALPAAGSLLAQGTARLTPLLALVLALDLPLLVGLVALRMAFGGPGHRPSS